MDNYKYTSLGEAYRSMYSKPQDKTLGQQYSEKRDEKSKERQKATLNVEAADLARVINAIIEEGILDSEQIKMIIHEDIEKFRDSLRKKGVVFATDPQKGKAKAAPAPKKPDTRSDVQKMADAYASPRKGPGGATRAD